MTEKSGRGAEINNHEGWGGWGTVNLILKNKLSHMPENDPILKSGRNQAIFGFIIVCCGVVAQWFLYPVTVDTQVAPIVLALSMGLYFFGLNVMITSKIKKDPELEEISNKIDALSKKLDEQRL